MKAVILAGGLGTRLKPFTSVFPKPLLPIGEKSIIEIMIQHLKECGFNEVIIATNYKSHLFENFFNNGSDFGIKIKISKEEEPLGTAGPLKLLRNELTEPFLVINGDILTTLDFRKLRDTHLNNDGKLTIATKEMKIPFHYGIIKSDDDILVTDIEEKPIVGAEINAGVYFMNPEMIDEIPEGRYDMTDLIKKMMDKKMRILKHKIEEYWLDIGQVDSYEKAQRDIEKKGLFNNYKNEI